MRTKQEALGPWPAGPARSRLEVLEPDERMGWRRRWHQARRGVWATVIGSGVALVALYGLLVLVHSLGG